MDLSNDTFFETVAGLNEFKKLVDGQPSLMAYFSTLDCGVCTALKPKLKELVSNEFPNIKAVFIEMNRQPEIAAQSGIFVAPTLIVYFDGREFIRKSRSFSLNELRLELQRPYKLMFEEE